MSCNLYIGFLIHWSNKLHLFTDKLPFYNKSNLSIQKIGKFQIIVYSKTTFLVLPILSLTVFCTRILDSEEFYFEQETFGERLKIRCGLFVVEGPQFDNRLLKLNAIFKANFKVSSANIQY